MCINDLLSRIMQIPSIKDSIQCGCYTAAEAEYEFRDQIASGDVVHGLLCLEDLPDDIRLALSEI